MPAMNIKEILPAVTRKEFRQWLVENHARATECWVCIKKSAPQPENDTLYYLDAVEEALCFGWIDSTNKVTGGKHLQRFSPRAKNSSWSELNKERCRRLEKLGLMTDAGRKVLPDLSNDDFRIDDEIIRAFGANPDAQTNFQQFPALYRRVHIDTIQRDKVHDIDAFRRRLARLILNCEQGKMYGAWNDHGRLLSY